jgi:dihydrofolate reductase
LNRTRIRLIRLEAGVSGSKRPAQPIGPGEERETKTFVYIGTSLDGFIARKDGDIGWLVKYEDSVLADYAEFISTIDAIVIGKGTFETVLSYTSWPYTKRLFVLSTTLTQIPESLNGKVTLLSMKPGDVLAHLSAEGYSNVYVDGGKVIQSFLEEDCIDELIITRVPDLIGTGIPLFGHLSHDLAFEHRQTKVFPNGLVKSHYQRKRQ